MAKVAFIGLGVMGFPMAGHLKVKGGHEVKVYNRTTAKAEEWVKKFGGSHGLTPAEAAEGADFIFTCVGNEKSEIEGAHKGQNETAMQRSEIRMADELPEAADKLLRRFSLLQLGA